MPCAAVALTAAASAVAPRSWLAGQHHVHSVGFSGVLYGFQASWVAAGQRHRTKL